jgi:crotonobetainyl-CoA:carnitine CoA-transferase CaiB-like acyl-CoA transferase
MSKNEINVQMQGVSGSFDTQSGKLTCVSSEKHAEVLLCFKESMNIPFAKIELYDSDRFADAKATFQDAKHLGEEIESRWNNQVDDSRIAKLESVAKAAECIRHWHDTANGGMIVSGEHVRALWLALTDLKSNEIE